MLQVLADLQFQAVDDCRGVSVVDHRRDIGADFGSARQDRAQRQEPEPPIDLTRRKGSSSSHRPRARAESANQPTIAPGW
jgi:hypothetical protein